MYNRIQVKPKTKLSYLQEIQGDARLHYGKGTGAGVVECEHCYKIVAQLIVHTFDKDNPDDSLVVGYYEPEHPCEKTGKTYTVGFDNTTPYDLMRNVMPGDISNKEWDKIEEDYYAEKGINKNLRSWQ